MEKIFYFYYFPAINKSDYSIIRDLIEPSQKISLYKKYSRSHTVFSYYSNSIKELTDILIIQDEALEEGVLRLSTRRPVLVNGFLVSSKKISYPHTISGIYVPNLREWGFLEERSCGNWGGWFYGIKKLLEKDECLKKVLELSIF